MVVREFARPHLDANMTHFVIRSVAASLAFVLTATLASAQVKEPPRAEKLDIRIRYRIRADRDERIRQYRILEKHLAGLGFVDAKKDDPDHDLDILDPNAERFTGTIPGDKALDVLKDVRVQQILFSPNGFMYPDAPEKPVAVKIMLRSGYLTNVQQQLHRQTVAHLGRMGFSEALGYDTLGYTLIRGAIPYRSLDLLVKDVRFEPSGWFLAAVPLDQLPTPLREGNPIRWAEVLPITEFPAPFSPPPVLPAQLRYSADLRAALLDPAAKASPPRVEVLFEERITDVDAIRAHISGRYVGASVDGVIGNVVSVRFPRLEYIERIAEEPGVLCVRLPRQGTETISLTADGKGLSPADAIKAARLDELHKRGYTGVGVKVILIGSDFTGADKLIGTALPKNTKIVDLTIELSPALMPANADPARIGNGTAAAKVLAAAAPDCELVLVRIDPGCFFHLHAIIKLARGEIAYTEALFVRLSELSARSAAFDREQRAAIAAYRAAFSDLSDDQVAVAARKKAKADLDAMIVKEKELTALITRFNAYQKEVTTALYGAQVFVNTLVWESGYPLDALSEFDGTLDRLALSPPPRVRKRPGDPLAAPKPPIVWVQTASAAGASVWGGQFLDANLDGLMEFIPGGAKLPADNWSPQLNFLGMSTQGGAANPEIPAGTKLRFVIQWREPAAPQFPEGDIPLYPLTLRLLRQIDPAGEKRSSDEMLEEARSATVPTVIFRTRTFLVFEQMLEYTVPAAGRYALAIEGMPPAEPQLPVLRREVEINPRLVVETVGTKLSDARAVFRSYTNFTAGVGTPADALGAVTIGVEGTNVQTGAGTGITLRGKPDVIGPAALAFGNDVYAGQGAATAFAGGAAVILVQARAATPNVFTSARIEPGKKLELSEAWLRLVPPQPRTRP
jgi:hypothetical protein